jgi:ABC-type Fe3+-siderophore transport system permease subunit
MNGVANGLYGGDLPNQISTPWIDFSEQSTIVGWSVYTQKTIRYKVVGKMVFCYFHIAGTSNSTTTTFTLPYQTKRIGSILDGQAGAYIDNGTTQIGRIIIQDASNIFQAGYWTTISLPTTTWTASGTKRILGQFFYEIE